MALPVYGTTQAHRDRWVKAGKWNLALMFVRLSRLQGTLNPGKPQVLEFVLRSPETLISQTKESEFDSLLITSNQNLCNFAAFFRLRVNRASRQNSVNGKVLIKLANQRAV